MNDVIYRPEGRAREYSWLAINHYIGCKHGCTYCWAPGVTRNKEFHRKQSIKSNIIERLRKQASKYAGTNSRVLLCFSTDAYQPLDEVTKLTREVIKILREFDIPFQILTKGGKLAVRDFDLYGPYDAFGVTLTSLSDDEAKKYEPYAAPPGQRIAALLAAKNSNIETIVSLEPVIDVKQTLDIIRQTHEYVDLFQIGKLNHQKSDINWRRFGIQVIELCRKFETDYYIKHDLAKYLDGIMFTSVDRRTVKRTEPSKAKKQTSLFEQN